jgi:Integrase core domain/HTH-like domain
VESVTTSIARLGVSVRVARSRELVARGFAVAAVARVLQISRQAIYRTPTPRMPPQRRPVSDPVEAAVVAEALANQTDGYRMICAFVRRKLGVAVNRKRVVRVMRERKLIQRRRPLERRKRPGFFRVERPRQLWQLDMTSVWVAEHGWTYRMAIIDCCTREIVGWQLELRCRADEAITVVARAAALYGIEPGELTLGLHRPPLPRPPRRAWDQAPPRRLPRPRVAGLHRKLVRETQRTGGVAERIRDARRRTTRHRRLRRPLPPPAALGARLPDAARGAANLGRSTKHRGLACQRRRGARQSGKADTQAAV